MKLRLSIFQVALLVLCSGRGLAAGKTAESPPPIQERVYMTAEQALAETFPKGVRHEPEIKVVTAEIRERLEKKLGRPVPDSTVTVQKVLDDSGHLLGYGVVSDEIGKYHPITFLVGATPELKVERVSILVYRESHGADVRRTRFLNQYRGKSPESPIRSNQDIVNISGATLSVQAMNYGVRKVLGLLAELYPAEVKTRP